MNDFNPLASNGPNLRNRLAKIWVIGFLLAAAFCGFRGLQASSATAKPTVRQTTVTKEVRRQTRMDEVKVGDVVLARDEFGDTVAPKKVTRVFRRTSDHLRLLTFESHDGKRQTIKTTDEHPFALADSLDFVPAGELTLGTEVPGPKGDRQTLIASTREDHPEGIPVFNFEVEGFHTYFVSEGREPVLVHNTCHVAEFEHRNSRGRVINVGEVRSGGTHPGRRLSWTEQQAVHTERIIVDVLDDLDGLKQGHTLTIRGQLPPCRSCIEAMEDAAAQSGATIIYQWPEGFEIF